MNRYLVAVMRRDLRLGVISDPVRAEIQIEGESFKRIGPLNSLNGFFDWLRDYAGDVVGLRHRECFEEGAERAQLVPYLADKNYAHLAESGEFELFFSDVRDFDSDNSNDEAFGNDLLYRSEEGNYCMLFQLEWLSKDTIHAFLSRPLSWVKAEPLGLQVWWPPTA